MLHTRGMTAFHWSKQLNFMAVEFVVNYLLWGVYFCVNKWNYA
jgi:hypothetical protein